MKKIALAAFFILIFSGICLATGHAGGLKDRLSGRTYSVISLERRDYDSINHASLDGLIFFPGKIKYHYIRRLDDDHRLKLNTDQGREAVVVKFGDSGQYERLISENKLFPHVLLGKDGKEAFTVYCNLRIKITWAQEKNNEIYLEARDPFKKDTQEAPLDNSIFDIRK